MPMVGEKTRPSGLSPPHLRAMPRVRRRRRPTRRAVRPTATPAPWKPCPRWPMVRSLRRPRSSVCSNPAFNATAMVHRTTTWPNHRELATRLTSRPWSITRRRQRKSNRWAVPRRSCDAWWLTLLRRKNMRLTIDCLTITLGLRVYSGGLHPRWRDVRS